MHLRLQRAAARVAVFGGILALGLGSTQASLAQSAPTISVPCSASALTTAMTTPVDGTVLILAPNCTYLLTAQLPTVMHTLTIIGHISTWITRSHNQETASFSIFVVGCTTGNLTLDNVNVSNGGGSSTSDGGAVYIGNGSATINGGIFNDNNTNDYGGAIANVFATLTVNGATFINNNSEYGGAIYSEVDAATIKSATFHGNTAYDGGAIYNNDVMTVSGSNFTNNSADNNGGAIYTDDNLSLSGDRFSTNDSYYGGGIYNDDILTVRGSNIGSNTAYDGAGVYNDEGTATFTAGTMLFNRASDLGGGIYTNNDGDETVTVTGTQIMFNTPDNCYPLGSLAGCTG